MISNRMMLAISCAVILAGCAVIYCFDNNDYGASIEIKDGKIDYSITGFMPCDYTYRVYSGADVPERIYLYFDENYANVYGMKDLRRALDDMEKILKDRGYESFERIDANGLKELIDDSTKAIGSQLVFLNGTIPDTIYNGSSMRLTEWMDNGGTVLWAGPEIGLYVSHIGGFEMAENGRLFKGHVNDGKEQDIESISEMGLVTGFSLYNCIPYGLEKDYPGSICLSTCSSDYSSASVMSYSNGRIYIIGGNMTNNVLPLLTSMAEIMICGINENTTLKSTETFHKGYGSISSSFDTAVSSGDVLLLTIGKPYSSWARAFVIP